MNMRAADSDREKYVELLQQAYVEGRLSRDEYDERIEAAYKAITYAQLEPLLADLPIDPTRLPVPPVAVRRDLATGQSAAQFPERMVFGELHIDESPVVAVFSQGGRDGRWGVPAVQTSVAVFGSVTVDLREAMLSAMHTEMKVSAVFGEVKLLIPEDIRVDVSGVGVFGEYKRVDERPASQRGSDPLPGSPTIKVTGAAVFGTVTVFIVSVPPRGADRVLPPTVPPPGSPQVAPPAQPPGLPPGSDGDMPPTA
jgi:Domain of unknown function (DUF1707)/Cell wall-active antibiotics response 4TMS YvqF